MVSAASFKRWHLGKELVRDLTTWTSGKAHSRGRGDSHRTGHRQEGACWAFLRNSKARVAAVERGSGNEVREDRIEHAGSL